MAYPSTTSQIIEALGYESLVDFSCGEGSDGTIYMRWNHIDPQPTEQQISDIASGVTNLPSGQSFSVWQAEHGGDPLLTIRRQAKEALDSNAQQSSALLRAVVIELINYCNVQRDKHNTLLTWIGTQATLTNRGQLASMQLAQATPAQARTAIKSRLDNGDADS